MNFLQKFSRACWMFIIPICILAIASIILFFAGYGNLAVSLSQLGTVCIVLGWLVYAVAVDSRKRWPNSNWFMRFHKIMTFSRK